MKVLIIIVTYNAMKWAEDCFSSTRNSEVKVDVMVIDNGSTDGTVSFIRTYYPEVKLIISETNLGFGLANNIGLQYVIDNNYDYAYLLNQDAWIFPDTIGKLIAVNKRNPIYGILSPMQMQRGGELLEPNFEHMLKGNYLTLLKDFLSDNCEEVYEVRSVMAAHWFMSNECIKIIGGFSPTFPHRGEDTNYADRVNYHRLKFGIVPDAKCVHDMHNDNPKQRQIYNVYIRGLVKLSAITNRYKFALLEVIGGAIIGAFRFKSLVPIRDLFHTIKDYRIIINNREISKGVSAFLRIGDESV